jgi:beta-glucosidase
MEPNDFSQVITDIKTLVNEGEISNDRIDDAVKRILTVKLRLGLFEHPYANLSLVDSFGNDYHRAVARRAVRESQVLLTNKNNIVPLSKSSVIIVAGSKADDIGSQCGGWTLTWQGQTGNVIPGTSILTAIKNVSGSSNVFYSKDGSSTSKADVAVVVVGETPYAEGAGDNSVLNLNSTDLNVIANVKKLNIPYVVILLSGRPLMVENIINGADAFITAWLPGTEAAGITDVLFGDYPFTGKLSHTWPTSISQVPINYGDSVYAPLFPYGYSYSSSVPVKTIGINSAIKVYPNPADRLINIEYSEPIDQPVNLTICNSRGNVVITRQIRTSKTQIGINNLPAGVYYLKILNGNDVKHGIFVKQ